MNARGFLAALLAITLATSMMGAPVAAAPGLNFSDDRAPNPYLVEDQLTVAQHDMAEMDSPLQYYDDSGNIATLPASVNESQDTPYTYRADQVNASVFSEFPRKSESASAIDASEWTTSSGASSSMSVSQTDGATASNVPAIETAATVVSGETATATYSNFSITNDPNKRVLRFVGNVDTLSSSAHVEVRAVDSDGDYKAAEINSSSTASNAGVIGASTGQGYVFQERLGDLATEGSGDGSFDGIEKIEVYVADADATLTIVGLDAESKSEMTLGETVNSNDETETVTERYSGGDMSLSVTSLDTLGSSFDEATLNDLRVSDVRYRFQDLTDADDYSVEFSDASDYGSYERKLEVQGRLAIPAAIDLSHSGLAFEDEQGFVDTRYATVEVAEGVGDQDFDNISSWSDVSDKYTSQGATHTLDSTVAVDKEYAIQMTVLLQSSEEDTLKGSPAGAGPVGSGGGGIAGMISGFFSTTVGKVTAIVGTIIGAVKGLGMRGS
jgi:hypothetical protein